MEERNKETNKGKEKEWKNGGKKETNEVRTK